MLNSYVTSLEKYIEVIKDHNLSPTQILEIGSRNGKHAAFFQQAFNIKDENVHVIDPDPTAFDKIQSQYPNFKAYKIAFSDKVGRSIFYKVNNDNEDLQGISSLRYHQGFYHKPEAKISKIEVPTTTGYDFLSKIKLTNFILKIDVEGHTYEVLQGFKDKIQDIQTLHIETELNPIWRDQKTDIDIYNFLTSQGFIRVYNLPMNNSADIFYTQFDQIWVNKKYFKYTLDNYFDKIYYINLKKDVDRNESILKQFHEFNITNFKRVDASVLEKLPDRYYWRNFNINSLNEKYILGSLGCRNSHLRIMEDALNNGYDRILIFEDDVLFTQDPNKLLANNINSINNWDMLYFGGLIEPQYRNQIVCAHAYGVNKKLIEEIYYMLPHSGMEVDNFYAKILQHMSYNYNYEGKYNIKKIEPFNTIKVNHHKSNIR
jgi:FkbM family methyltransferase